MPIELQPLVGTMQKSQVWASNFVMNLKLALGRVRTAPYSHDFAFENVRLKVLHRFPYVIYFVIEKSEVRVLAVLHGRQDNNIVKQRQQNWPS